MLVTDYISNCWCMGTDLTCRDVTSVTMHYGGSGVAFVCSSGSFGCRWDGKTDLASKGLGGAVSSFKAKVLFSFLDNHSSEGKFGGGSMFLGGGGGGMVLGDGGGGGMFLGGGGSMLFRGGGGVLVDIERCDGISASSGRSIPFDPGWTFFGGAIDELPMLPKLSKPVLTNLDPSCEFWKDERKQEHSSIKFLCVRVGNAQWHA